MKRYIIDLIFSLLMVLIPFATLRFKLVYFSGGGDGAGMLYFCLFCIYLFNGTVNLLFQTIANYKKWHIFLKIGCVFLLLLTDWFAYSAFEGHPFYYYLIKIIFLLAYSWFVGFRPKASLKAIRFYLYKRFSK